MKTLTVWVTEGDCIVFENVGMSWIDGDRLLFHTKGSGGNHPCGINTNEVIAWEFTEAA
jgi:hypothetical protein